MNDKFKKQPDIDITEVVASRKCSGLDLSSRQDAIEAMEQAKEQYFDRRVIIEKMQDIVNNLSSAEPEIIYCKDCQKHNVSIEDWYDNRWKKVCPLVGYRGKAQGHEFDYQFCAYAERRTDD